MLRNSGGIALTLLGVMHSWGMSKDGCYCWIDHGSLTWETKCVENVCCRKEKKNEECSCSHGLARLDKTPRTNVAVEQAVTPHEKSFSKGTKATLFYLYCRLKSVTTVATKLCTF